MRSSKNRNGKTNKTIKTRWENEDDVPHEEDLEIFWTYLGRYLPTFISISIIGDGGFVITIWNTTIYGALHIIKNETSPPSSAHTTEIVSGAKRQIKHQIPRTRSLV